MIKSISLSNHKRTTVDVETQTTLSHIMLAGKSCPTTLCMSQSSLANCQCSLLLQECTIHQRRQKKNWNLSVHHLHDFWIKNLLSPQVHILPITRASKDKKTSPLQIALEWELTIWNTILLNKCVVTHLFPYASAQTQAPGYGLHAPWPSHTQFHSSLGIFSVLSSQSHQYIAALMQLDENCCQSRTIPKQRCGFAGNVTVISLHIISKQFNFESTYRC